MSDRVHLQAVKQGEAGEGRGRRAVGASSASTERGGGGDKEGRGRDGNGKETDRRKEHKNITEKIERDIRRNYFIYTFFSSNKKTKEKKKLK